MQIVHLTSVHPRHDTRILLKECTSLARSGYETTLIVADGNGDARTEDGVEIVDVGPAPASRLGRMFVVPWKMLITIWRRRPSLVHFHDPELIPVAILMGTFVRHVIFDMHENVPKQILDKHWIRPFARKPIAWVYTILERLTLNRFNVVFAERSYADDYPWLRNSVTILNLPAIEAMPKVVSEEKYPSFTVGYIGGCTEERGIVTVATAISMLRARGMEIQFDCIGPLHGAVLANPSFREGVESGWIMARGRLQGREGWKFISRCHAGIAVLRPMPNYIRSWPTKMFEYMAMGLPVVVSDFPVYREVVEQSDCGFCVDPDDPVAIADALEFLVKNPVQARRMGANGRMAVSEQLNWHTEERKLLDFYQNLDT